MPDPTPLEKCEATVTAHHLTIRDPATGDVVRTIHIPRANLEAGTRLAALWNLFNDVPTPALSHSRVFAIDPESTKPSKLYAAACRVLAAQIDVPPEPWASRAVTVDDEGGATAKPCFVVTTEADKMNGIALGPDEKAMAWVATTRTNAPHLAEGVLFLVKENERLRGLVAAAVGNRGGR